MKVLFILILVIIIPFNVIAHSGGTDSSGCHYVGGEGNGGSRHCHNGSSSGGGGTSSGDGGFIFIFTIIVLLIIGFLVLISLMAMGKTICNNCKSEIYIVSERFKCPKCFITVIRNKKERIKR